MRGDDRGVVLGLYRHDPDRELIAHALELGVCGIDTAYNYRDFTSHHRLATLAGDLLPHVRISTKVGFFPNPAGGPALHSLDPARLRAAVRRSCEDLGRAPDVILLHNPEHSLTGVSLEQGANRLTEACTVLTDAVQDGLAHEWGISSWHPRPVLTVARAHDIGHHPPVVMVRAGLTLPDPALTAARELGDVFAVTPGGRWGMSPFAGSTTATPWRTTNLSPLLITDQHSWTTSQAAFRLAYELPPVTRVAVGTSDRTHLRDLLAATRIDVDLDAIDRYRALLRAAT